MVCRYKFPHLYKRHHLMQRRTFAYHYLHTIYLHKQNQLKPYLMQRQWCADVLICTKKYQFYIYPIEIKKA